MTTVFLSGSRRLSRTNDAIRKRLENMISCGLHIIVGDANGADKAMQSYFAEAGYGHVTVYCAGTHCRNNVGGWTTRLVETNSNLKGRDFYVQKDKEMAKQADFGFVLWDGKSAGSMANMFELLKSNKTVVVYFGPEKEFYNLKSVDDADMLLTKCAPDTLNMICKKTKLTTPLRKVDNDSRQKTLSLTP